MTTVPLVGMYYRPPAGILIKCLPFGATLMLYAEPDNPYDPNAIRVECDPKECDLDTLATFADELERTGHTVEEVLEGGPTHLGYVAKAVTSRVREHFGDAWPGQGVGGRLGFKGDGGVFVELDEEAEPDRG